MDEMTNLQLAPSTIVEETVLDVSTIGGRRMGKLSNGQTIPVGRRVRPGHTVKVRARPQLGGRGGGDDVAMSQVLTSSQDLALGLGISAVATNFAFSQASNTPKLLGAAVLDEVGATPGFVSRFKVGGQNLFASNANVGGVAAHFPLAAFLASNPGYALANNVNCITPQSVPVIVEGGFFNAQTGQVIAGLETNIIPEGRWHAYRASEDANGQDGLAIGNVNFLFGMTPSLAVGAGNQATSQGQAARACKLGQLVAQVSDPATNTIVPNARGFSVVEVRVGGRPLESGSAKIPLSAFAFDAATSRFNFLGKALRTSQQLEVDVVNETGAPLDVTFGTWLF
jgi:hypothetical protein